MKRDDEIISNISELWTTSEKDGFGKERKSSSQYGTYEKNSSIFGINNTNVGRNDINYSDTRKMLEMLTEKIPYNYEQDLPNVGSKQINPWLLENLIMEEFHLRSINAYFESKMHHTPSSYLLIFELFKNVVKLARKVTNKSANEITEDDLINKTVIDLISRELKSKDQALYINQYLKKIAPFKNIRVKYVNPSKEEFHHPLVKYCERELKLKGTKERSIYSNLVVPVRLLFKWLTENVEDFKHKNINNIIVNEIKTEHINDYKAYLLRLVNEGEMNENSPENWIVRIRTFFSILYQKKRISSDIASNITMAKTENSNFLSFPLP